MKRVRTMRTRKKKTRRREFISLLRAQRPASFGRCNVAYTVNPPSCRLYLAGYYTLRIFLRSATMGTICMVHLQCDVLFLSLVLYFLWNLLILAIEKLQAQMAPAASAQSASLLSPPPETSEPAGSMETSCAFASFCQYCEVAFHQFRPRYTCSVSVKEVFGRWSNQRCKSAASRAAACALRVLHLVTVRSCASA